MKTKVLYLFSTLVLFATIFSSCKSTGVNSLKRGDYYQATMEAVDKLRTSPDKPEPQDVLLKAYPLAVQTALREIDNAKLSNSDTKYDVIVLQYERLNILANNIYTCPKAYSLVPYPQEFHAELNKAKTEAAEKSYELGEKALKRGTLADARIAYQHFLNADNYVNSYRDVKNKIDEALYASILRVVVEPPITPGVFQISSDFFYNNLVSEITKTNRYRFVRFYTPEEARMEKMNNPHQYLVLDFTDFTIGNVRETSNSTAMSRDSVVVGSVTVDGKNYNTYATVKAQYTKNQREIISGGTLNVRIVDAANRRIIEERRFDGRYVWATVWANYTGDDRALSNEQKRELNNKQPQMPPPNQDLFIQFTVPIYTKTVDYVYDFYKRQNLY